MMDTDHLTPRQVRPASGNAARSRAGRRALPWAILCLFAFMALGWRTWGDTPLGVLRYFHLPMLFVLASAVGRMALLRRMTMLVTIVVLYTATYMAFSWYNSVPPYALQQAVYLMAAFSVAAWLRTATETDWRILRWAGPVAVGLFLLVFWIDARSVGIDAVAAYRSVIASGDLNIIQFTLFEQAFNASVGGAVVNSAALRGQVFAGILVPIYVSMYACTIVRRRGVFSFAYWSSIVIGGLLILFSLARALQLAALLALALPAIRTLRLSRARLGVVLVMTTGLAIFIMGLFTPVAGLVWKRLTADTGSYGTRVDAMANALDSIASSPVLGSYTGGDELAFQTGEFSAHSFILDAAVIGGLLTGTLALAIVLLISRDCLRGFRHYLRDSAFLAPLAAALLTPVAMFTSGSGTLQMPECMGLALFYGAATRLLPVESAGQRSSVQPRPEWPPAVRKGTA